MCVIEKVLRLQCCQHLPNAAVHCDHHRSVNLPAAIGDIGNPLHIPVRRLVIRLMRGLYAR